MRENFPTKVRCLSHPWNQLVTDIPFPLNFSKGEIAAKESKQQQLLRQNIMTLPKPNVNTFLLDDRQEENYQAEIMEGVL